jgi:hypothetical protein
LVRVAPASLPLLLGTVEREIALVVAALGMVAQTLAVSALPVRF